MSWVGKEKERTNSFYCSTIVASEHFDLSSYEATNAWFEKMKGEIPNYEKANGEGAAGFGGWFKAAKAKREEK